MNFFEKNSWLNFFIGLTGFYFVFSIMQIIMGKFGPKVAAVTSAASHVSGYYWLISFGAALVITLIVLILFCKPRAPFYVFSGILIGGALGMYYPLYVTVINLDQNVRREGLVALYELVPHLTVLVGALIALYVTWLSNRLNPTDQSS
jgi:MFS family permease